MPSPYCNDYSSPSLQTQHQIVQQFLRTSVENVELSLPVQHNASSDSIPRIIVTVSLRDVTGMKPYPGLSSKKLSLRVTYGSGLQPSVRGSNTTGPHKKD
ncbi:hypothetical protein TNCV_623221 [Trichonephila clavipes]|nr:hypothetical protein TNCV_623221 [Trichonephila clavipes]